MTPVSPDPDMTRALADPTIAFTCDCAYCDDECCAPPTLREAIEAGWHNIEYVGGEFLGRNYLGLCPVCSMIEANQ
jgi:hypothetical protein